MTLPQDVQIRLLQEMMRIRCAEETLADLYPQGEMRTPTHFSIGQEAVAVGVGTALNRDDVVYSGHRCHAHYLAKGGDLVGMDHAVARRFFNRHSINLRLDSTTKLDLSQ